MSPAAGASVDAQPAASTRARIFVLPMNGGEPHQLTRVEARVTAFAWKPDGTALAFVADAEAAKRTGPERHNGSFEVGRDSILTQAAPKHKHLWWIAAEGGKPRQLTNGIGSVAGTAISWSPDGPQIVFARASTAHTGDQRESSILVIDVAAAESHSP